MIVYRRNPCTIRPPLPCPATLRPSDLPALLSAVADALPLRDPARCALDGAVEAAQGGDLAIAAVCVEAAALHLCEDRGTRAVDPRFWAAWRVLRQEAGR